MTMWRCRSLSPRTKVIAAADVTTAQLVVVSSRRRQTLLLVTSARYKCASAVVYSGELKFCCGSAASSVRLRFDSCDIISRCSQFWSLAPPLAALHQERGAIAGDQPEHAHRVMPSGMATIGPSTLTGSAPPRRTLPPC